MDKKEIELAKAGLDIYAQELGPTYQAIRDELVLHLGSTTLDKLRTETAESERNVGFLRDFRNLLPVIRSVWLNNTSFINGFLCKDVASARLVQASTVYDKSNGWTPYYVVGERSGPSKREVRELLILPALDDSVQVEVRPIFRKDVAKIESQNALPFTPYTDQQVENMYNPATRKLIVSAGTPGSVKLRDNRAYSLPISDAVLAEFDTFTHLNKLATAFCVVDELHGLLDSYVSHAD